MAEQLRLSVVIPCRNEVKHIEGCVESIMEAGTHWDGEIHVYVVDGLSEDGTREKIHELQKKYSTVHLVINEKQLTPYAFNLGIHAGGRHDFVLIVGARHILSPDYIERAVHRLQENEDIWCVGGRVINVFLNHTGEIIARAMGTGFGMGLGNFRTLQTSGYVDTVGTPMFPAKVFEQIGYFDEELTRNQDDDFSFRITQAGGKIFFDYDIPIQYFVRGSFDGLRRQFYQYGYWKVYVNRKHKSVTTIRQLVPPAFVVYLVLLPCTFFAGILWGAISAVPFVLYLLMNLYFSATQAKSIGEFVALIRTYFILHISYGLGYLKGIMDFLLLNRKPSDRQKRLSR